MSAISSRRSTSVASLDDEVDQAVESLLAMSAPSVEDSLRSERLAGDSVGEERDHPVDERKRDRVCGNATGRLTAGTSLPETGSGEVCDQPLDVLSTGCGTMVNTCANICSAPFSLQKRGKNELLQLAADIRALRGTLGIVGSPTPPSPFGIEAAVTSSAADGQVTSPKDVSIMDSECQTTEKGDSDVRQPT